MEKINNFFMKKTIFFLSFGLLQGCFLIKAPSTPIEKLESYYNNLHKLSASGLLKENFSIKFHKVKNIIEQEECFGLNDIMKEYKIKIGFLRFLLNQGNKIKKDSMKEHLMHRKRGHEKLIELLRYRAEKLKEKDKLAKEYNDAEKQKIVKIFKYLKYKHKLEKMKIDNFSGKEVFSLRCFLESFLHEFMTTVDNIFTKNATTFETKFFLEKDILNADDDSSIEDVDSDFSEDDWKIDIYEDKEEQEYKKFFPKEKDQERTVKRFKEEESKDNEPMKSGSFFIQTEDVKKNPENLKFQKGAKQYLELNIEEKKCYLQEIINEFCEQIDVEASSLEEEVLKNIVTTLEKENNDEKANLEDKYYKKKELEKRLEDIDYLVNQKDSKIFFHINREKEFKNSIEKIKNIIKSLEEDLLNDRKKLRFLELQQKLSSLSLKTSETK